MWSWIVLVLSGVLEAVWATALGKSEGFSRLGASIVSYSVSSRVWLAWRTQCEACQWGPLMRYGWGLVPY
jgi:multidrug transporter EmrE-like cation transporter